MYEAYLSGKDLYAVIGSIAFKNNYEDNLEFRDGVLYSEGKRRRSQCKSILLGRRSVMPLYVVIHIENNVNRISKRV